MVLGVFFSKMVFVFCIYPLVNSHSHGKSPFSIENTCSNGGCSSAILVYQRVFDMEALSHMRPRSICWCPRSTCALRCRTNPGSFSTMC